MSLFHSSIEGNFMFYIHQISFAIRGIIFAIRFASFKAAESLPPFRGSSVWSCLAVHWGNYPAGLLLKLFFLPFKDPNSLLFSSLQRANGKKNSKLINGVRSCNPSSAFEPFLQIGEHFHILRLNIQRIEPGIYIYCNKQEEQEEYLASE